MTVRNLQITILTLLSILLSLSGIILIYLTTNNIAEISLGLGISLTEMGLLGVLYEHVIKRLEKDKDEETKEIERLEGRSCITELLKLKLDFDGKHKIFKIKEEEKLKFIRKAPSYISTHSKSTAT